MRTIIIGLIFFSLVALLFFGLFNQPVNQNIREVRLQMRTDELVRKEELFKEKFLKRCLDELYEEAETYVDSLIASPTLNPVNELDSLRRPYRPDAKYNKEMDTKRVPLEPLFDEVDSTRMEVGE